MGVLFAGDCNIFSVGIKKAITAMRVFIRFSQNYFLSTYSIPCSLRGCEDNMVSKIGKCNLQQGLLIHPHSMPSCDKWYETQHRDLDERSSRLEVLAGRGAGTFQQKAGNAKVPRTWACGTWKELEDGRRLVERALLRFCSGS